MLMSPITTATQVASELLWALQLFLAWLLSANAEPTVPTANIVATIRLIVILRTVDLLFSCWTVMGVIIDVPTHYRTGGMIEGSLSSG